MKKKGFKYAMLMMGLLLEFSFALLGGAVLGVTLDNWLHTKPWLTLAGMIVAGLACLKILFIIISKAKESMENESD